MKSNMTKSVRASLLALSIAALPLSSGAAGLGQINVFSGLGQPLRAEIQVSASAQELQSLSARIASAEAFRRANLSYGGAVSAIRVSVDTGARRPVIRLSSVQPINEPFVDLLVELNWANGQLLREYTFLLDPVDIAAPRPIAAAVNTPAAAPAPRAVAPVRRSAEPAVARQAPDTYRVRRGDTMHRIGSRLAPSGASLDQMLIALQRANPQAFEGANINRLRAGVVLDVPSAEAVRAIDAGAARREVRAQAADFEAYRRGLAGAAAARPAAPAVQAEQESAGRIVPKVEEPALAQDSGDQVRVAQETSSGEGEAVSRLQALEEELSARTAALDEANARLAQLENSVRDLQRLLELQSGTMSQLQAGAESVGTDVAATTPEGTTEPAPASVGEAASEPVPQAPEAESAPSDGKAADAEPAADAPTTAPAPVADAEPAPTAQPEPAPQAEAKPPQPAPAPKPAPVAPPPPPPAPSFMETLLADPTVLYGGGGILALLLAYAGLKTRQRRKEAEIRAADAALDTGSVGPDGQSVFSGTGGQSVDTGATSIMHTDFSQTGLSAIDTDEGVDPVAEADVYMAYGRDVQAEEILQDALKADPARAAIYLKLLEIYAQRRNTRQFETVAGELFARTGGQGRDWDKAAALGRKLDPENPLYGADKQRAEGLVMAEPAAAAAPASAGVTGTLAGVAGVATALTTDAAQAATSAEAEKAPAGRQLEGLDFTTSSGVEPTHSQMRDTWTLPGELDKASAEGGDAEPVSAPEEASVALDAPALDAGVIDFDLDLGDEPAADSTQAAPAQGAEDAAEVLHFDPLAADEPQPPELDADLVFDLDIDEFTSEQGAQPAQPEAQTSAAAAAPDTAVDMPRAGSAPQAAATEDASALASSLDFELPDMELGQPETRSDLAATMIGDGSATGAFSDAQDEGLSFDLSGADFEAMPEAPAADEDGAVDLEKTSFDNSLLDFDFELDTPAVAEPSAVMPAGLDLNAIDLELDSFGEGDARIGGAGVPASMAETQFESLSPVEPADDAQGSTEAPKEDAGNEEAETKLELARAYEEMGDNEGALELLQEVLAEGVARQQAAARDMIARLS